MGMSRPPVTGTPRSEKVSFRLTTEERDRLDLARAGKSISDYVRHVVDRDLEDREL